MPFAVWNILDMVAASSKESVEALLSSFSCSKEIEGEYINLNPDIEHFIKENAVQFALEKKSVTYIVGDASDGAVLGYFTLAHKSIEIPVSGLSKTTIKRMSRFADLDDDKQSFTISSFLIAQFGKNYAVDGGKRISGKDLMELTQAELMDSQHRVGGGMEYLDCLGDAQLIDFYEDEGFRLFGERTSKDGKSYLQYMRFF